MNRMLTRKLAMAARTLEFLRAHPFTDRNQATVATQFEAQLAAAESLFLAEHKDRLAAVAAQRHGADLRRGLEAHLLPSMERIGAFATRSDAQVASRFATPPRSKSQAAFVTRAASLLEVARAHQDALTRNGLARGHITELANGLAQFRDATTQAQVRRQHHHDTRTKLERSLAELIELLRLLDAYNRVRFQRDAGLLTRWTAVRTVGRVAAARARRGSEEGSELPPVPVANSPTGTPVAPSEIAPASAHGHDDEPPREGRPSAAA